MTRRKLILEGQDATDGRYLYAEALTFKDVIPVYDREGAILGKITDCSREPDGWVTGEVEFLSDEPEEPFSLCAELDQISVAGMGLFTAGRLAGMLYEPGWGKSCFPPAGEAVVHE